MTDDCHPGSPDQRVQDIAREFVTARMQGRSLGSFPGRLPADLTLAYRCQDAAIELWQDQIGGWKVGRIPPAVEDRFGCDRLAGPIFRAAIRVADGGDRLAMPVFAGGFAAVEAEYVAVLGDDAPPDKQRWSLDEARDMVSDLRIGLEVASSPLATINELGPLAVISDFGNNAGLIVGASIPSWQSRPLESLRCQALVDGCIVGNGGAFQLSGGFLRSVQFMLELAARRGHPLRTGMLIATGQTTGIHDVLVGHEAHLNFHEDGELKCRFVAAVP